MVELVLPLRSQFEGRGFFIDLKRRKKLRIEMTKVKRFLKIGKGIESEDMEKEI